MGSQHRAFEELCYQLIPTLRPQNLGSKLTRLGTPDGGVEALVTEADGTASAWQAKYFAELADSQLKQMDKSFTNAITRHPQITKYYFCLPIDRGLAPKAGAEGAMDRWNKRLAKWSKLAEEADREVKIEFVGHSELMAALTSNGQEGRIRYWFDLTLFGEDWFDERLRLAISDAGPRYSKTLRVDLPISQVFDGLARSSDVEARIKHQLGDFRESRHRWWSFDGNIANLLPDLSSDYQSLLNRLDYLDSEVASLTTAGVESIPFMSVASEARSIREEVVSFADRVNDQIHRQADETQHDLQSPRRRLESILYALLSTGRAIGEIHDFLTSEEARLANEPVLFVKGRPGTGKTHLLCDAAMRYRAQGYPVVLAYGQKMRTGEPWSQIVEQLQLEMSPDEFLGALTASAEATGTRALVLLDALNEGEGRRIWPEHLSSFLDKVKDRPRIAVAITCRTNYVEAILPEGFSMERVVEVEHHGFEGFEIEAAQSFFDHYELNLPDFPLMSPEFGNPLFLKLLCDGLEDQGAVTIPRGSIGISWVFALFVQAANNRLSRPEYSDFRKEDNCVWQSLEELAGEMVLRESDELPVADARAICDSILGQQGWDRSLYNGLLKEDLIMEDFNYNGWR
ncbi:MAG TPA: hypothetical protein VMR52_10785 [Dehalococcoidia bacterium]|nr:hypothetical protein [Dehalococcoidia bacterium]